MLSIKNRRKPACKKKTRK